MKIVFLDRSTIGMDVDISFFSKLGKVVWYSMTVNSDTCERIREADTVDELLSIWEDMKHNGFLSYRVDSRLFDKNIEEFKALSLDEQKRLLLEMLDYNELYVNYSEIDDGIYGISEEDKRLNKEFYEV